MSTHECVENTRGVEIEKDTLTTWEYVGDDDDGMTPTTIFGIRYCPFCGMKLDDQA